MRTLLLAATGMLLLAGNVAAQKPQTTVAASRLVTQAVGGKPQTTAGVTRPQTTVQMTRPQTTGNIFHPQSAVQTVHPQTTVAIEHPVTRVAAEHPVTTAQAVHPQTTAGAIHPTTPDTASGGGATPAGGKTTATSMSNFQPKKAKDFTAGAPGGKAAPNGGAPINLGNETNESAKDSSAQSSTLRTQQGKPMDVNPAQSNVEGLNQKLSQHVRNK